MPPLTTIETTPPGLALYRAATRALGPLAGPWLEARAAKGKEERERLGERLGRASSPRPEGPLVWLHGASVGESLMLLALLGALARERPGAAFLVTTGTVTSAALMRRRLPPGAIHQYAPLDAPASVRAFLDHWRPDLGVLAESELWPNLLVEAKARGVKLALVNARMTERSLACWRRRSPHTARYLLSLFDWIGAADRRTAAGLGALAGRTVELSGNLKLASDPPPVDAAELARVRAQLGDRHVWVAASTHPGEEEIVLAAHGMVRAQRPDSLLILVPRHPERGAELERLAEAAALPAARRAAGQAPEPAAAVYVADTLGEMGLWYRLEAPSLIGGSLVGDIGGHNPLEPALLSAPILTGPHTANFAALYEELCAAGGAARVQNGEEIAKEVLGTVGELRHLRIEAARSVAVGGTEVLEGVSRALRPLLPGRGE